MNALTWLRNRRPVPPSPAPPPAPAPVLVAEPKPAEPQPTPHIPFPREPEPGPARHGRRRNLVDCGCIGRYSVCRCPEYARKTGN